MRAGGASGGLAGAWMEENQKTKTKPLKLTLLTRSSRTAEVTRSSQLQAQTWIGKYSGRAKGDGAVAQFDLRGARLDLVARLLLGAFWTGTLALDGQQKLALHTDQGDAKGAERFARASTHWMRHSHASHAIASGMPIEIAQQNLGHASLATTTVYVTTEKRRRMKAVEAFWRR